MAKTGHKKEGVKRFVSIVAQRYSASQLTGTSIIIAYYVLLSLFPLLILLGNLLPLFQITPASAVDYMKTLVPEAVMPVLEPILLSLLSHSSGGLLSVSSIALLFTSGRGISHMQSGMNRAYGIPQDRGYLARHLVGFLGMLLILLLIGLFLLVFSFGDMFLGYIAPKAEWAASLRVLVRGAKWPVTLGFMFCLLTIVYVIAPSAKVRLRDAMPGAALASGGLLLLVQLFALYVNFSTRAFSSYGALSSFFVLMFWLNFSAMLVVVGAVLNASIQEFHFGKESVGQNKLDTLGQRLYTRLKERRKKRPPAPAQNGGPAPQEPPEKETHDG